MCVYMCVLENRYICIYAHVCLSIPSSVHPGCDMNNGDSAGNPVFLGSMGRVDPMKCRFLASCTTLLGYLVGG